MKDYAGISNMASMCTEYAVGITQAVGYKELPVASIFSHELGHSFGMDHDNDRKMITNILYDYSIGSGVWCTKQFRHVFSFKNSTSRLQGD